jgi:hypothetical protein
MASIKLGAMSLVEQRLLLTAAVAIDDLLLRECSEKASGRPTLLVGLLG